MFCAQAITCLPRFASELRARGGQYIVSKPPQISHHVRSLRAGMPGSRSRERCQACWQQLMRAMLMQHLGSLQHGPTHATRTPTRARRVSFAYATYAVRWRRPSATTSLAKQHSDNIAVFNGNTGVFHIQVWKLRVAI